MSSLSRSFFCTSEDKCLVCGQDLNDDASQISKRGWDTFLKNAEEWSKIKLPLPQEYYMFTRDYEKVSKYSEPFGRRHCKNVECRFAFGRKDLRDSLIKEFETC